ncbi:DNA methyltransferase [Sphingopyxis sp. 2PD]|uniref:DNA modification methylase n=1 Tax=Sphingopyxis sp. 2PD TaxID=2502196 RepID=UPI0010F9F89B|nr:DNA methyltransferase [Sphingopyxis sp. 2PD]
MTTRDLFNSNKLKKQLQAKTGKRRAENQADTQLATAQYGLARNDLQPAMRTVWRPIGSLVPGPNRTRETTSQLLESTMRAVNKFGIVLPILIDKHDVIVAGHGLWEASKKLGLETIECRVVEHLNQIELEALSIALNRIGEIGKYDLEKLRDRMIAIESHGIELISTGFTLPEIGQIKVKPLVQEVEQNSTDGVSGAAPISRIGDLYCLGKHKLLCGDSLSASSYELLLEGQLAGAVFSDPPYNCRIKGFVGGLGKHEHEDFVMFAGQESTEEFRQFLTTYLGHCRTFCSSGAVIFVCMDWRQIDVLFDAGRVTGLHRINLAVWNKGSGGMGGLYRSAHELVAVFCTDKSPVINNVALGVHGRDRTNVWTYSGANRAGSSAGKALADHPTPKPVELVVDALLDVTHPGDIVIDPFIGSGTTIIAGEQCNRSVCGIELDPKYVDRTIRRWEALTGEDAIHVESGLTFTELTAERSETEGGDDDE